MSQHFPRLQNEYGVAKIGIIGSVVREEQTDVSDVDILVEFSQAVGMVSDGLDKAAKWYLENLS